MPGEVIPKDTSFAEWLDCLPRPELVSEVADLAEFAPYVKAVVGVYKWFRLQRFRLFLRSLGKTAKALPDAKKKQFCDIISSEAGGEILSKFVDSVLRTSSQTAISALALLYVDTGGDRYKGEFRSLACVALEGLSDQEVDAFLALCDPDLAVATNDPPYPVVIASDGLIPRLPPNVQPLLATPEARVAIVNSLIRRGLLLPDFASARYGDGGVGIAFGLSQTSYQFRDLLMNARSLLPADAPVSA